ncbi:hypothetical protein Tco_0215093 [Tanacetum coccineum]
MSSGLSASIAAVESMSESMFCRRFRSSTDSSSVSPPDLPSQKHYRGMSELVEDTEEDDDKENEEIKDSLDSDSVSEDAEDEGSTAEDEDPAAGDEGLAAGVEGPGTDDKSYSLDDESHGLDNEGQNVESDGLGLRREKELIEYAKELALEETPILTTWTDPEDGMVYIDVPTYPPPAPPVQTPPLPEWMSAGSSSSDAGGLIHDHAVRLEELLSALFERYDRDIRELFTRSRAVREEDIPRG